MNIKRIFGFILIIAGLFFLALNPICTITGNVVFEGALSFGIWLYVLAVGLIFGGVLLILVKNLETLSELLHKEAHSATNYQRMKERLAHMEETEAIGTDPKVSPPGRYLNIKEEADLRKIILKYLPEHLKTSNVQIGISGSLSRKQQGKRYPKFDISDMESDEFYLSDIDIGIEGSVAFDYIYLNWRQAVKPKGSGRGAERETYRVTNENFLTKREKKVAYMDSAPDWIKDMIKELSEKKYVGENRPLNIKFYKDFHPEIRKDMVYKHN